MGASLDFIAEDLGGRDAFLTACRQSQDSRVQEFLTQHAEHPDMSLQDLCTLSGQTVTDLLSLILASQIVQSNNISLFLAASNRPLVMLSSIQSALLPGAEGFADRQMQLKIGGLIPKEGGGINIINQMQVGVKATGIPGFEERARMTTEAIMGPMSTVTTKDIDPVANTEEFNVPDIS